MCGITGFLDSSHSFSIDEINSTIHAMYNSLMHRGPDDEGAWIDPEEGIALGFRRLAILDLSPAGRQPMISANGRFVIVFNGEIYNFMELRDELMVLGHTFRGHSDTEVMLAAICQWGLFPAVRRFNGMFAIALWDRQERKLHLIRDRLGIKPLYYGMAGRGFLFGSELKALCAHPFFISEINRDALALYLRHNCIPAPHTIYKNIFKLLPGTILTLNGKGFQQEPEPSPFWQAQDMVEKGLSNPFSGSDQDAIDALDGHLRESVRERMVADVPLGAFLSGGIDSSTIVALMQVQSSRPIKTFSIGFQESGYDEAKFARQVACRLGTDHTELYVTPEQARDVIPHLPDLYDEPFGDSSQIPTFLISELARQHVTVSLSGDGGDELFGGYNRYSWVRKIWNAFGWIPTPIRSQLAEIIHRVRPAVWDSLLFNRFLPPQIRISEAAEKMRKIAESLSAGSPQSIYLNLVSHWKEPDSIIYGAKEPSTSLKDREIWDRFPDYTAWMMYMDLLTYLPDDILVKVDRASMAVSLEARVPYLDDHRVAEFAWQLPMQMKIRNGQGKWLLRQVLHQYVPADMIARPKKGFGIPIDAWLRGPLAGWVDELLNERRLKNEGYFHPEPVLQMWKEHRTGEQNWQYHLWDVLMFEAWLAVNG